ncbi:peptide ABC transporter substrate-binding protein [Brevibacillus reuszeri]|uniref:ABC transporter substrate-binding protein n=1 Tax=Brevibacillus reuszeri TaxID=54915 RepID=UPI001B2167CB|nr:ABC transporter substrate-binding protein [Brevibacillus reuszeri]GIO06567.1 peptide ABC transporter substrate-binding protein [Brevibacillus reuszeri]
MKKKGLSALLLSTLLVIGGCEVATKKDVVKEDSKEPSVQKPVEIVLLTQSRDETDANVIRDQLSKSGFHVKLNLQPDFGSYTAQEKAGNYDVAISSWTTVTGNPDYAVRSLFKTGGDYNKGPISDPEIDELIDKAASQTAEEYKETYEKLEQRLVFDKAYIAPLYVSLKSQGLNHTVLKESSVRLSKSRSMVWEAIDFVDESKRDKDPLILQQAISSLTSLDPIKGNDGSINMLNTNMYVRLVNLTDDDKITSEGALSHNYAIAEGNSDYYFLLRDDISFAKIKDKLAVDSGERVGAEDVIFSLNRAKNKDAVPDHRTYSLHEHIQNVELVTDPSVLSTVKQSGASGTIKEALEKGLKAPIHELTSNKADVNNQSGKYQVVKLTTTKPFPQVLNYLAHQSAGIVSKKQVESINTFDVAKYDVNKDISYGDQSTVTEGAAYNNALAASGPYILSYKNDYEAVFYKNPGYRKGTEFEPKISKIVVRFIKDADSALAALRSGEIHVYYGIPETKFDLVQNDSKLKLQTLESNGVAYLLFNLENREVSKSEDLRKAVLYAINQEELIKTYNDNKFKASSTLTPLVKTGLELQADSNKVKEYLKKYAESK